MVDVSYVATLGRHLSWSFDQLDSVGSDFFNIYLTTGKVYATNFLRTLYPGMNNVTYTNWVQHHPITIPCK